MPAMCHKEAFSDGHSRFIPLGLAASMQASATIYASIPADELA
jgi:hypothetical protein